MPQTRKKMWLQMSKNTNIKSILFEKNSFCCQQEWLVFFSFIYLSTVWNRGKRCNLCKWYFLRESPPYSQCNLREVRMPFELIGVISFMIYLIKVVVEHFYVTRNGSDFSSTTGIDRIMFRHKIVFTAVTITYIFRKNKFFISFNFIEHWKLNGKWFFVFMIIQ